MMSDKRVFKQSYFIPKPYIALHIGHYNIPNITTELILQSLKYKLNISQFKYSYKLSNISKYILLNYNNSNSNNSNNNMISKNKNYFHSMHTFEDMDLNAVSNITLIHEIHMQRNERIKTCNHTYLFI